MTSWWRKTSRYLSSHSNFFIVTGGIVGGAYLVSQYAISKFQQIQEKLTNDKNAKENLRRRFAQNQEDCTFTVLALLPTLGDQLFNKHNVEQLTESLRSQAAPSAAIPSIQPNGHNPPLDHDQTHSVHIAAVPQVAQQPDQPADSPIIASHSPSDATSKPAASSPQLNPLAKSFVPGNFGASDAQSAPGATDSSTTAPVESQINGATGLQAAVSPQAGSLPTSAAVPAEPAASSNDPSQTIQSEPSHVDAQEQRNKILADRQAKLKLWNNLKLTAFTRTVTSLYCVVLLTLQTHIQLNLIGRFAYLASVQALAHDSDDAYLDDSSHTPRGLDHDTERLYLTFSWWFLHHGWDRLSDRVSAAVEKSFAPLSVKAQLSMADMRALLNDARYLIEHEAPNTSQSAHTSDWKRSNFMDILFPNSIHEEVDVLVGAGALDADDANFGLASNHKLRALLDETKDIIESPDFGTVLAICIDRVFETFYNSLNPTFGIKSSGKLDSSIQVEPLSALESRFQEITEEMQHGKRVRLASLFPLVSRQSQMAIRGVPNEYIEALADSKELRAFSAVLYAAWSSL